MSSKQEDSDRHTTEREEPTTSSTAMGDTNLASVAAAALRDKIVYDQQQEIRTLRNEISRATHAKQKLIDSFLTSQPVRILSLVNDSGKVYAQSEMDVTDTTMHPALEDCDDLRVSITELIQDAKIQLDGGQFSVRVKDLKFETQSFKYCESFACTGMAVRMSCPGLVVHVYMGVTLEEYCQLTGVQPSTLKTSDPTATYDSSEHLISPHMLLAMKPRYGRVGFGFGEFMVSTAFVRFVVSRPSTLVSL